MLEEKVTYGIGIGKHVCFAYGAKFTFKCKNNALIGLL